MAESVGQQTLRKENVDRVVKGFALQAYTMKQFCLISPSSAWKETYFTETAADLTASGTGNDVKGVPRLANFPYGEVTWTEKYKHNVKHAMDSQISWEDAITNDVPVVTRTLLRNARAVAKSVDEEIWDTISESQSASDINSVAIAAGSEWDSATIANRDPIDNILEAKQAISEQNYNPEGGYLLLNPKDYRNLLSNPNIRNAGQFWTDSVTRNGNVGRLLGLNVVVSNSVTADYALVIVAKEACTWKTASPLKTVVIEDPGIKWTIRSWELGVAQLTNPKAVCLISNTAA